MLDRSRILPALFAATAILASTAALAQDADHPRRAQVNKRLENQNKRIQEGEKNGKLTPDQAKQLHREDHRIRKEERNMAAKDGGHITKKDQAKLNRQENKVSKQIHEEKHPK